MPTRHYALYVGAAWRPFELHQRPRRRAAIARQAFPVSTSRHTISRKAAEVVPKLNTGDSRPLPRRPRPPGTASSHPSSQRRRHRHLIATWHQHLPRPAPHPAPFTAHGPRLPRYLAPETRAIPRSFYEAYDLREEETTGPWSPISGLLKVVPGHPCALLPVHSTSGHGTDNNVVELTFVIPHCLAPPEDATSR